METLGNLYFVREDFEKCVEFSKDLIMQLELNNDKDAAELDISLTLTLLNIGRSLLELKKYPETEEYLKKAKLQLRLEKMDTTKKDTIMYNILLTSLRLFGRTGRYKEAMEAGLAATEISQRTTVDHDCVCDDTVNQDTHRSTTKLRMLKEMFDFALLAGDFIEAEKLTKETISLLERFDHKDLDWRLRALKRLFFLKTKKGEKDQNLLEEIVDLTVALGKDVNEELLYSIFLEKYGQKDIDFLEIVSEGATTEGVSKVAQKEDLTWAVDKDIIIAKTKKI